MSLAAKLRWNATLAAKWAEAGREELCKELDRFSRDLSEAADRIEWLENELKRKS